MRLIVCLFVALIAFPAEKVISPAMLSDADARAYLLKKNAAAEAETAVLMRYAQYKQQQEAAEQAFNKDMDRLQPVAKKAVADFQAALEALKKVANCLDCDLDKDLNWVKPPTPKKP